MDHEPAEAQEAVDDGEGAARAWTRARTHKRAAALGQMWQQLRHVCATIDLHKDERRPLAVNLRHHTSPRSCRLQFTHIYFCIIILIIVDFSPIINVHA